MKRAQLKSQTEEFLVLLLIHLHAINVNNPQQNNKPSNAHTGFLSLIFLIFCCLKKLQIMTNRFNKKIHNWFKNAVEAEDVNVFIFFWPGWAWKFQIVNVYTNKDSLVFLPGGWELLVSSLSFHKLETLKGSLAQIPFFKSKSVQLDGNRKTTRNHSCIQQSNSWAKIEK